MEAIQSEEYKGHTISLHYDQDAESPRSWDNVGVIVCWHRRYNLGDKHSFADPQEFREWIEREEPDAVLLSLFLYDHSGISISVKPFGDPWDSGAIGYIYVTKARALAEYGDIGKRWTDAAKEKASKHLALEIEVYDSFLRGEVYGYNVDGPLCDDSCWGFIGESDYCLKEARAAVDASIRYEEEQAAKTGRAMAL